MAPSIAQQLTGLLGGGAVLSEERLDEYSIDGLSPLAVVQPDRRQGIVQTLRWAAQERIAVFPRGGGTQLSLGNVPGRAGLVLDLSRCGRILDFQPSDLTVTVEAGITLDSLRRQLAQGGKFLAVEAPLAGRATIGGILASNASGPLRLGYGLARDWLIGISVASAQGVETKAGGKVVKNVTGYDLGKLYTGSLGTLGVIVEATFKLSPLPLETGALAAVFPSLQSALDAGAHLLRQVYAPQGMQVIDAPAARRMGLWQAQHEGGTSSGGELPEPRAQEALALAFFSGRALAVRRSLKEATGLFHDKGASRVEETQVSASSALLRRLTDLGWGEETKPYLGLKISVPLPAVGRVAAWLGQPFTSGRHGLLALGPPEIVADPGFGLVWLLWWTEPNRDPSASEDPPNPASSEGGEGGVEESRLVDTIGRIREMVRGLGGSAVVEHAPLAVKRRIDVWSEAPGAIEIMRRIKRQFDPQGTLNPGRFVGGI